MRTEQFELRRGESQLTRLALAVFRVHANQAIGRLERIRCEERGVDDAEDGGVGADAEAERQDRYRGEARVLAQRARRVAHVLRQLLDA